MALAKPAFSKALFHSRMPSRIGLRYLKGIVFSSQKMIGVGRRHLGRRVGLAQVPAIDVAHEAIVGAVLREVLDHRQEVAHAVVGQPRLIAGLRQPADRVGYFLTVTKTSQNDRFVRYIESLGPAQG